MPLQLTATRGRSHIPFLDPLDVEAGVARMRLSPGRRCLCPGNAGPPISPSPPPHTQRDKRQVPESSGVSVVYGAGCQTKASQGKRGTPYPEGCLVNPWPPPKYHPHEGGAEAARTSWTVLLGAGSEGGRGTSFRLVWGPREQHLTGSQGWASGGKGSEARGLLWVPRCRRQRPGEGRGQNRPCLATSGTNASVSRTAGKGALKGGLWQSAVSGHVPKVRPEAWAQGTTRSGQKA